MRWRAKGDEDLIRWSIASHQATAVEIGNEIQSVSKLTALTRFLQLRFRPDTVLVVIMDPEVIILPEWTGETSCYLDFRRDISVQDTSMDSKLSWSDTPHTDRPPMIRNKWTPSNQITLISMNQLSIHINHSKIHHILQPNCNCNCNCNCNQSTIRLNRDQIKSNHIPFAK